MSTHVIKATVSEDAIFWAIHDLTPEALAELYRAARRFTVENETGTTHAQVDDDAKWYAANGYRGNGQRWLDNASNGVLMTLRAVTQVTGLLTFNSGVRHNCPEDGDSVFDGSITQDARAGDSWILSVLPGAAEYGGGRAHRRNMAA